MIVKITIEVDGQELTREYIVEKTLGGSIDNLDTVKKGAENMVDQLINQEEPNF